MFNLKQYLLSAEDEEKITRIFSELRIKYKDYKDPWGFNIDLCEKAFRTLFPLYRSYFKVRVFGQENIEDRPYIVVSNHTGQLPIDAMLLTMAFVMDVSPPRVLRAMVERFLAQFPFLGDLTAQAGSILGDRSNCEFLIENGESILVFPEGVKGIAKSTKNHYKLQPFSLGFYRIALQKKTPILPISVIGAEEMFPFVLHSRKLARLLKVPALPLTANLIPLPSPIDIHIGKPIEIPSEFNLETPEKDIKRSVLIIESQIKEMIKNGLETRRPFLPSMKKTV